MAQSNGSGNGFSWKPEFRPPSETTTFVIGGQDLKVPALTLFAMDVLKKDLLSLGPDLDFISYAGTVVRIVYSLLRLYHPDMDVTEEDLLKACSLSEMRELAVSMNNLLGISGFQSPPTTAEEEAPAPTPPPPEVSGTGTSTESLPISPPTESVAETSTG